MAILLELFDNKELISTIPSQPGVYIIRSSQGEILYVGKAKNLKNRLRSYLKPAGLDIFKLSMLQEAKSVEIIVVESELEALLLESNLIKEHRPPYNVVLKDDKSYPYLRITLSEKFPRVMIARRIKNSRDFYFGPFTPVESLKQLIKLIKGTYPIAQKNDKSCQGAKSACIYYQMGKCSAPCVGYIQKEQYMEMIDEIKSLLSNPRPLKAKLSKQLMECIESENFEEAIKIRDKLKAIELLEKGQSVSEIASDFSDVIAFARKDIVACVYIVNIRFSNIVGNRSFFFYDSAMDSESIESFILQYYSSGQVIPDEIITEGLPDKKALQGALESLGKRVKITQPERGKKLKLLELARKNAQTALDVHTQNIKNNLEIFQLLRDVLQMEKTPFVIDIADISHISFQQVVGGVVRYSLNGFEKDFYRRYQLEERYEKDAMREMMLRHKRLLLKGYKKLPDVIVVDGGNIQINAVKTVFPNTPVIGIAKLKENGKAIRSLGEVKDTVYINTKKSSVDERLLHFLQKLRDEAHRFAVGYHRKKRQMYVLSSVLDRIEFLGEKRKKALLEHFGSIEAIKEAPLEQLIKVPGISYKIAAAIKEALNQNN